MSTGYDLLTAAEVADILRVSQATISRWGSTKVLHPVRIEGTVRYRRSEIDALVKEHPATADGAA